MKLNGQTIVLESDITLQDFLEQQGFQGFHVAVEKNSEIVPKSDFEKTIITNEDTLEVVSFVGGG